MNGAERGQNELLGLGRTGRRRRMAGLLGAEASRDMLHRYDPSVDESDDQTGAAGDKRIETAAEAGHAVGSDTVVPPTQVGAEDYHG